MPLPKSAVQLIGAVAFLALVVLSIHFLATPSAEASPVALTKSYSNAAYGFALKMPAAFSAYPPDASPSRDATGAPTGQAIVLKDTHGAAVQIVVTPDGRAESTNILTAEDIEQIAPYYDLSEAEPIQITPGVIGTTFTDAEHPVYGSSAANVWFAYRGNLYEVIADAKDGALFRSMIATWTFF
jgi:hypothetical protein